MDRLIAIRRNQTGYSNIPGAKGFICGMGALLMLTLPLVSFGQYIPKTREAAPSNAGRSYEVNSVYRVYPENTNPASYVRENEQRNYGQSYSDRNTIPKRNNAASPVVLANHRQMSGDSGYQQSNNQSYQQQQTAYQDDYRRVQYVEPSSAPRTRDRYNPVAQEEIAVRNYTLQQIGPKEFEMLLNEKLGSRCVSISNRQEASATVRYRIAARDRTAIDVIIDRREHIVSINGKRSNINAMIQIIALLDTIEDPRSGVKTDVVPFHEINDDAVRRMAAIVAQRQMGQQGPQGTRSGMPNPLAPVSYNEPASIPAPTLAQPLVASRVPAPQDNNPAGTLVDFAPSPISPRVGQQVSQATRDTAATANMAIEMAAAEGRLSAPVYVEILTDLDLILIRGKPEDVEIVKLLIKRIEETGEEQEPEILLYELKHTDSYRVASMLQTLYSNVYLNRRGTVSITSLTKPNAVLLIGRKESVDTAKNLIEKLDLAVNPDSQFKVVRLKHANSDTVATYITNFYSGRYDLGAQVVAISDFRSNSIIVQANPRDMIEVMSLIMKLDTTDGPESIMKVFYLKNAMAETLVTVLQNAFSNSTTGTTGMGAAGTSTVTARNAVLTLATVDRTPGNSGDGVNGDIIRGGLLSGDTRFTAAAHNNSIIATAPAEMMELIEILIRNLDELPIAESQMKVFQIINGDAQSLTTMLRTLFQTATTTGAATTGTSATLAMQNRPGLEEGESSLVAVRLAVDVRTNTIVASGTPGDLMTIETVLATLDEDDMENRKVMVYRLLNSPSDMIAEALNDYLSQELQVRTGADTELMSVPELVRRQVIVVSETITNSLIITATPYHFEEVRRIIKALDERPPMVSIDVLIADVVLTDFFEFGVELGLQDPISYDRGLGSTNGGFNWGSPSGLFPNTNDVAAATVATQGITSLAVPRSDGGFLFSASSEAVSVLIQALERKGRAQLLSRPQVTTLHNQPAFIQVGESVPTLAGTTMNDNNVQSDVEYQNVGLILGVTPRVSADGLVVMEVDATKSQLGSESEGVVIAIQGGEALRSQKIEIQQLQSTVSAMSGQTLVLGGLISQNKDVTNRSVPLLSKIPVLGNLFQYNSVSCTRSEMVMVMTPTVLRNKHDIEFDRQRQLSRMHWCLSDVRKVTDNNVALRSSHTGASGFTVSGDMIIMDGAPTINEGMLPFHVPSEASPLDDNNMPIPNYTPSQQMPGNNFPSGYPTMIPSNDFPRMAPGQM